jgi:hypothetical protein
VLGGAAGALRIDWELDWLKLSLGPRPEALGPAFEELGRLLCGG